MAKMPLDLPKHIDGKKIVHPYLIALEKVGHPALIEKLGVSKQMVSDMRRYATADRNWAVPAHHVLVLAEAAELPPYIFRPDVYTRAMLLVPRPVKAKKEKPVKEPEGATASTAPTADKPKRVRKAKAVAADPVLQSA